MCGKISKAKKGKRECVCMCGRIGKVKRRKRGVCGNMTKKRERWRMCVAIG
jgi:hypothetical protein